MINSESIAMAERADGEKQAKITIYDNCALLKLERILNIATSRALQAECEEVLKGELAVFFIDGSSVQAADTASLQLLIVLMNKLSEKSLSVVSWLSISNELLELVRVSGLQEDLKLTQAIE